MDTMNTLEDIMIPDVLKGTPQWGVWRSLDGKKVPYTALETPAAPNKPETWLSYEAARTLRNNDPEQFQGLGFVFSANDRFAGVDLDACRHPKTKALAFWAQEVIQRLETYTEVSPSGTGVKLFLQGSLARGGKFTLGGEVGQKKPAIESYSQGRYFTVTGEHLLGTPSEVHERQEALDALAADVATLIKVAKDKAAKQLIGGDLSAYNGDASAADMALVNYLAQVVGNDAEQIERLFKLTLLHREKTDSNRGGETYLQRTIRKALESYKPLEGAKPAAQTSTVGGGSKPSKWPVQCVANVKWKQPQWLWEPLLPRGYLVSLAGDTGSGKTTIATLIATRLTKGLHLYTGEPTGVACNVLFLVTENHTSEVLAPQVGLYGGDAGRVFVAPIPSLATVDVWRELLETYKPVLVIVDLIQEAMAGVRMNSMEETRKVLAPIGQLAEHYNTTILFIQHLGKDTEERKAYHRTPGSVNIGAQMRSELMITVAEHDPELRTIAHVKANLSKQGEPIRCRIVTHVLAEDWELGLARWEGMPTPPVGPKTKVEECAEAAQAYLHSVGGRCPSKELNDYLEQRQFSRGTYREAFKRVGIRQENGVSALTVYTPPTTPSDPSKVVDIKEVNPCRSDSVRGPSDSVNPSKVIQNPLTDLTDADGVGSDSSVRTENKGVTAENTPNCQGGQSIPDNSPVFITPESLDGYRGEINEEAETLRDIIESNIRWQEDCDPGIYTMQPGGNGWSPSGEVLYDFDLRDKIEQAKPCIVKIKTTPPVESLSVWDRYPTPEEEAESAQAERILERDRARYAWHDRQAAQPI
jgi:putative DNA primase/helicase